MRSAAIAMVLVAAMVVHPVYGADAQGTANVELVKTYVRAVRVATLGNNPDQDLRPVAEKYVSEDYVEHTYPMDRPGREGYIQMMLKRAAARRNPPASSNAATPAAGVRTLDRVLSFKEHYMSDGEYVVWTTELPGADPKGPPTMSFNMVHIVNGKVTEHWASS